MESTTEELVDYEVIPDSDKVFMTWEDFLGSRTLASLSLHVASNLITDTKIPDLEHAKYSKYDWKIFKENERSFVPHEGGGLHPPFLTPEELPFLSRKVVSPLLCPLIKAQKWKKGVKCILS
jgi:hypothetical protein